MFISRILDYHKPLNFFADGDDDGGGGQGNWRDDLPDDLKGDASLVDVPDVATLAKNYVETKKMVGNSFRVPGEDAGKEDWDSFHDTLMGKVPSLMFKPDTTDADALEKVYDQLGRPEKDDAYKIPEIDNKGLELDMSLAESFKPIAHKYGLNQKQFDGVVKELTGATIEQQLDLRGKVDQDVKALQDEWGAAYERQIKLAIAAADRTNAPPHLVKLLKSGRPPSDLAKYFFEVSKTYKDGEGNPLVQDEGSGHVMTPNDAQEQMAEMRRNRDHALNNPADSRHQAALEKYGKLAKLAYPEARSNY